MMQKVPLRKPALVQALLDETDELVRIFHASLRTAGMSKANRQRSTPVVERSKLSVGR